MQSEHEHGESAATPSRSTRGRFESIPLVDIAALSSADIATRREVARSLDRAARSVGFLYVTGHGIEPDRIRRLIEVSARFFALEDEIKLRYYIGLSRNHRGYVPPGEEVFYGQSKDTKEAFDLGLDLAPDDVDYLAGNRLLGPNVWPSEVLDFSEVVSTYHSEVLDLGRRLFRGFALGLELPETYFEQKVRKPPSQLRLVHYPPQTGAAANAMGIGSHTDYECFTILHSTAPGLEVMNAEGRWVDAPPVPGAFVVNIGDMLEVLTNGTWVSTAHRVRPVLEERYSFPFFFSLDYHEVVEPLPQFVDPSEGGRYPSLVAGDHLLAQTAQSFGYFRRLTEAGKFTMPAQAMKLASFGRDRAEGA